MKVFAIVITNWNSEYDCEEYSKPIVICSTEEIAEETVKELTSKISSDEELLIIPYTLK